MRSPVTGAPYSGVEVTTEQQVLAGGNTIQRQTTRTTYRDGQGRVRTETEMSRPGGTSGQTATTIRRITISDPVAGYIHEVNPQNKTVNSRAVRAPSAQGAARLRNPNGSSRPANTANANVQTESLGTQTINGIIATGTRVTHTVPAGTMGNALPIQSVRETWMAEDLKVPVMVKTTDPRFGTRVTQLTQVNRGEPDASLFQVPAGYTIQHGPAGRGPRPGAGSGQIN